MQITVEVNSEATETKPEGDKGSKTISTATLCLTAEQMKKVAGLRPNTTVELRIRGQVRALGKNAAEERSGVEGELTMTIAELHASRGSEFDALLDE